MKKIINRDRKTNLLKKKVGGKTLVIHARIMEEKKKENSMWMYSFTAAVMLVPILPCGWRI